jgi:hypothetical protein
VKGKGNEDGSSDKRSESSQKRKGMTHSSFWGLLYIHELSSGVGTRVVTRVVAEM